MKINGKTLDRSGFFDKTQSLTQLQMFILFLFIYAFSGGAVGTVAVHVSHRCD